MELNFIIFPAPKPSYDSETLENELIWVPVLDSLSTQTEDNIINLMENNIKTQELTKRFKYYGSLGLLNKKYTNSFVNKTKPKYYIPCLLLQSSNAYSSYILIYFHGNGEDVKLSHDLLANLRNNLQIHVIAMEYPGYGIYKGNPSADKIIEDSQHVYDFLISLGFKRKNIIVFGRSIGTGVATELAIRRKIAILALMAPFTSLRAIANDIVGRFFKYFVKERFCNIENLTKIDCPTLIVHGVEDSMISLEHSIKLHGIF